MRSDEASNTRIVDMGVLKDMLGDDDEVVAQFLRNFLKVTSKQFAELQSAASENDAPRMTGLAHTLKSSSRWVGAESLGALFAELEQCVDSRAAETRQRLETIQQQYEQLTKELQLVLLDL